MPSNKKTDTTKLQRAAKGKRPQYFSDPATDRLLTIVLALVNEVSVLRDRLDTVESLLEKNAVFSKDDIENFAPSEEHGAAREKRRAEYLDHIFRVIQSELDDQN